MSRSFRPDGAISGNWAPRCRLAGPYPAAKRPLCPSRRPSTRDRHRFRYRGSMWHLSKGETAADTARIVQVTVGLERFWRSVHGWAPKESAAMLAAARLDRQVSFARTLERYREPFPAEEAEALLILGYVTLRSLCEGVF